MKTMERDLSVPAQGEMGARIRDFDWSATPIGPMEHWPRSLTTALSIVLGSRYPMFLWWGPDLVKFYNDPYIPMLGRRHPAALGSPGSEVWSEIWDTLGPQVEIVRREARATWNEDLLLIMQRNGYPEECYFTFSYSPVIDESGEVGGVFCACNESTGRVIGERRLAALRQLATTSRTQSPRQACKKAARIFGQSSRDISFALIYLTEPDGEHLRLQASAGIAAGGAHAPETVALSDPAPGTPSAWPFAAALAGEKAVLTNLQARALPGGPWPEPTNTVLLLPLKGTQGQPIGVLVAGASPRRALDDEYQGFFELAAGSLASALSDARAYEEEKRRSEALAELDRAKTTFFGNISHELRTPLTLMLGPLEEELRRTAAPSENLVTAYRNSRRLQKLVNALLDFSRLEAGRMTAHYQPTDLAVYTAELASGFRSAMEKAGLRLTVSCPPLPELVHVDREMWEKIVLNLLGNAFKFTLRGGVSVSLRQNNSHVELAVSDTGAGIPAPELPRLFERFYRVRGAAARSHEGTGIGLALVRELVRLHGGEVAVASTEGAGSTFTVTLPLGTAHLPAAQIGTASPARPRETGAAPFIEETEQWLANIDSPRAIAPAPKPLPAIALPRVLVVDDNADMRAYLRNLLVGAHEVELAADGETALASIRRHAPDLVLADVMMPRLDGFALLARLRADAGTRAVPVILLSARAGEEASVQGLEAGADDYIVKPFGARELLARVRSQLDLAKLRHESAEHLNNILENITDGFQTIDAGGRYTRFNGAMRAMLRSQGMDADTLIGQRVHDVLPELRATPGGQALDRTLGERVPTTAETYFPPWRRWFWIRNHPLPDGGAVSFSQDITERKLAEQALRDSENRYRAFIANSSEGIWRLEFDPPLDTTLPVEEQIDLTYRNGRFAECNEVMARMYGLASPKDLEGRSLELMLPRADPASRDYLASIIRAGYRVSDLESVERNVAGDLLHFSNSMVGVVENGRLRTLWGTQRDITERRRAEERERELSQRALAATAKFEAVFNQSGIFAGITDLEGRVIEVNDLAVEAAGYTKEQVLRKLLWETAWWRGSVVVNKRIREAIARAAAGEPFREILPYWVADGGERVVDFSLHPIRDQAGKVVFLHPTGIDITDRVEAEQTIRQSEERFRSLVSIVTDVPWVVDAEGRFISPQEIWENYTGQTWEEHRDFGWAEALHPDDRARVMQDWLSAARNASLYRTEGRLWHAATQTYRYFSGRATPLFWPDGTVREWIGAYTDVHEQRVAEEKLEGLVAERTAALKEKVGEMETFSYSIAHDMRAPLRSLRGFSEILLEEHGTQLDPEGQEFLRRIAASATRMDKLIHDILGYSRVMQGEVPKESVNLSELLRGMIESYPQLSPTLADIHVEGELPAVLGSEAMFTQVFSNLLGNAVRFVAPGVRPLIRIWAEPAGERTKIFVRDNGIGIDTHQHEKVFAIFQQVNRSAGGTGIGLAIVKKAVERMGGTVTLHSELGRGSTFVLDVLVA